MVFSSCADSNQLQTFLYLKAEGNYRSKCSAVAFNIPNNFQARGNHFLHIDRRIQISNPRFKVPVLQLPTKSSTLFIARDSIAGSILIEFQPCPAQSLTEPKRFNHVQIYVSNTNNRSAQAGANTADQMFPSFVFVPHVWFKACICLCHNSWMRLASAITFCTFSRGASCGTRRNKNTVGR